jgi:DnaJ-class molecular chaperone
MANPYETLGVAPDARQDDIRKAYRKAAKETHPDLNPGNADAEKRFKEINAAYDIVGDADKRKRYDAGEIDETGAERQPERHFYREYAEADPNTRYRQRGPSAQQGADFDYDIFDDLFRGRGGGHGTFRMPPQDVRYTLDVGFLDAVNGGQKRVTMPDGKTLDITIPAGITDGQVLRLKGQGLPGSDGKQGDAYVQITVRPHPGFRRDGNDILTTLPVSLGEALNGASVRVETVDGAVDVKVPKGAREGTKLRLRGKGVAHGKDGARGDQLVEIHIVPPDGAEDALAEFMAEWEKTHPQNPRRKGAV